MTETLTPEEVKRRWSAARRTAIPTPSEILEASIANLGLDDLTGKRIDPRFGDQLEDLMDEGLRLLRERQELARREFTTRMIVASGSHLVSRMEGEILGRASPSEKAQRLLKVVAEQVAQLPPFVLSIPQKSLDQQTKKRAGVHMEGAMAYLFRRCGLPFEQETPKKSDFVFPDEATWSATPELAVLVQAKRTLAERWKQLSPDRREGRNAFLVTLESVSQDKAARMLAQRFVIYMPEAAVRRLTPHPSLRNLNDLPSRIRRVIRP